MKTKILSELANIICFTRIIGSLLVLVSAIVGAGSWPGTAAIYSALLCTDLLDGYCYRKYSIANPPRHWFNQLPISMDQLGDFSFTCSGIIYLCLKYAMSWLTIAIICAMLILVGTLLAFGMALNHYPKIKSVCTVALVYGCFLMMITNTFFVWKVNAPKHYYLGFILAMIVFYALFFKLEPKERRFRH